MKVKCIDNHMMDTRLTVGKVYEATRTDADHYRVMCDDNISCNAMSHRFVIVDDMPVALVAQAVSQPTRKEQEQDLSDWRTWRHKAPGECVCGIPRTACDYHR